MINKIAINLIWILAAVIISCSGEVNSMERETCAEEDSGSSQVSEIQAITIDSLTRVMEDLIDSSVVITGFVDHVCRHGGMKMNLVCPQDSISIHAVVPQGGERLNDSLNQKNITVRVVVREHRIDQTYLDQWELQLESEEDPHLDEYEHIRELRTELENTEKGYISEYWLELQEIIQ